MSFQAIVPLSGPVGWQFLSRSAPGQKDAFAASPTRARDIAHFRDSFPQMRNVEDVLSDRRVLSVALGAFGLEGDLGNKAFVRTVLQQGTEDPSALANRLADKRYLAFAKAFGPEALRAEPAERSRQTENVVSRYLDLQFEASVGETDGDLRLALALQRELGELAVDEASEQTKYLRILGDPALRTGFQTAFGLPGGFAVLDLDRQVETLQDRVEARFGTSDLSVFADPAQTESLVQLFLLQSSLPKTSVQTNAALTALRLLGA